MELKKAIEILTYWGVISEPQVDQDLLDAVKLGIEALKQRQQDLEGNPLLDGELLPGETEGESHA